MVPTRPKSFALYHSGSRRPAQQTGSSARCGYAGINDFAQHPRLTAVPVSTSGAVKRTFTEETAAESYLAAQTQLLTGKGLEVDYVVQSGAPGETIVKYAQENECTLIAIATHGTAGSAVSRSAALRLCRPSFCNPGPHRPPIIQLIINESSVGASFRVLSL